MTRLAFQIIKCPKCGVENRIVYYASICTFLDLDGSLISRLLDGTLNTSKCENCGVGLRLSGDVLINGPNDMFNLNPADDVEYKKKLLKAKGIMSEKGEISSGLESTFLKAKNKLNLEKEYQPSPRPPPAPKITPNTEHYNEIFEEVTKKILKNKTTEKDKKSKRNTKNPVSPLPPPPPPPPPPSTEC